MQRNIHSRQKQRGSALIEIALSYGTLVIVSVLTLKAAINTSTSQTWTVKQAMSDAYLTRETALAQRIPFDTITGPSSLWRLHPSVSTSTVVIGKLPGGKSVVGSLHRTRIPAPNNLTSSGGSGNSETNPGGTEAWRLQSLLVYHVDDKDYVKTRTVLRTR
jgi:hypothetical protein